ncbi:MAG: hypothetical protein FJ319_00595 [SAR202 cluster bacterium]|nr:hypothetical protein [SAR202 cluster bacterium]
MTESNPDKNSRLRIIVLGDMVRRPLGDMVWGPLQYVMGLSRLGHDVCYLVDSLDYPDCFNPIRNTTSEDPAHGLAFMSRTLTRFGHWDRWAYHYAHTGAWHGPASDRVRELASTADALINVSAVGELRPWLMDIPARVFVDTNPGATQTRMLTDPEFDARIASHNQWSTFGGNINMAGCRVPAAGIDWRPTRQPVVMDAWPVTPAPPLGLITAFQPWERPAAGTREAGRGPAPENLFKVMDLPEATGAALEVLLRGPDAPRGFFESRGWRARDALDVSLVPMSYQRYVHESRAALCVATPAQAWSNSGRLPAGAEVFLASGRPVMAQDTGLSSRLPVGEGLLAYASPEEAAECVRDVNGKYARHSGAARELAEAYFDSRRVLSEMLEAVTSRAPIGAPVR